MPDKIISEPSFPAVSIILSFRLVLPWAKLARPAAPGKTVGAAETAQERGSRWLPGNPENERAERATAAKQRAAKGCARRAGYASDEHALRAPALAILLPAARFPRASRTPGATCPRLHRAIRRPSLRSCQIQNSIRPAQE